MSQAVEFARLDGDAVSLVVALTPGNGAELRYLGARLPPDETLAALHAATSRGRHESQPDIPPLGGLVPERKAGWAGMPAVTIRVDGHTIDTDLRLSEWSVNPRSLCLTFTDEQVGIEVDLRWSVATGDVIVSSCEIINRSTRDLMLDRLASLALPLPRRFDRLIAYSGRWAGEMREQLRALRPEGFHARSAIGKPGFGGGNWLLLRDTTSGEVLGAHLAWSGDYATNCDCTDGGQALLQLAADWDSGEVPLPAGTSFESPEVMVALAPDRSTLAQRFHAFGRTEILPDRADWGPRKVHLNSWEALGFALKFDALRELADSAAELGVERFVLDDGWFGGRRNDRTSLGDWEVSPDVLPDGLDPLIAHIHGLGMDFGLWVEPEMVSPESELYRAHPDWCLHIEGRDRPTMRHQLVLDLTRDEVCEYVIETISNLLTQHEIAYLKWDHNRDLFPASGVHGSARFNQTSRFYYVLNHLRAKHPGVEIESCSSGGGRIDLGVLQRSHRVWPSDNNDAIERVRIIHAWSQFLPLEVLGNHVGPSPNPITGRQLGIDFRAKVALFGHMGVEADPRAMPASDRELLAKHIALYKRWREVLHSGSLHRLDHPDDGVSGLLVTADTRALALVAQTGFAAEFDVAPIRLKGLDPDARYRVALPRPWPAKASLYLPNWSAWQDGITLSGGALMTQGLALPLTHPETAWLIALERMAP